MDKYSGYVIVVYVVTLGLLFGYLAWMWLRLRAVKNEAPLQEQAPQTPGRRGSLR
ncbi:hypothetical protein [Deinococcus gobiensis]|uniref:hypothetical protein n=1 Tax=Deinococcus gobiensis TaxID=502394 RepID=UPI0002DC07D5|nr:hypothetical protein [Deinococcus gobiensis]